VDEADCCLLKMEHVYLLASLREAEFEVSEISKTFSSDAAQGTRNTTDTASLLTRP
jgi:hypothetical protein